MYSFEQYLQDKEKININGALLNLTDQCNCRCKYCDFVQYKNSFMTKDIADKAINYLQKQNTKNKKLNIAFFGGEPLINWEVIEYLVNKYSNQFSWSITTNGTLLDNEKIKFLQDNQINVLLSIDGDKETQDFNRPLTSGKSSFDLISKHINILPQIFKGITFRSTLYPPTVHNFTKNYFFAVSKNFINYYATPDEYSIWTEENISALREGLFSIVAHYIYCLENNITLTRFSDLDKFLCEYLIAKKEKPDFVFEHSIFRCGLGTTGIGIGTNGWIFGCQEHSSHDKNDIFYIGDIFDGIDDQKHYNLIKTFFDQHLNSPAQPEKCLKCQANYICHGTRCPSRNYLISQNFDTCSAIRCQWIQLLHEAAKLLNQYFEVHYCENYEKYIKNLIEQSTKYNYSLAKEMILQ